DGAYMYYSNNTIFNQNYIWARDYGVYFNNLNTYAPINRKFEVTNNMVYSEGDYGMYFYYVDSVDIFHNSIHVEGTSSPALQINESTTTTISDYDIRNNILSSENSIAFETNSSNSFYDEFNYNIFYSTGSALITIDGVSYSDLSSYQQQNSWNLNSFEGNPEFVSNTDLRIIGLLPNDNG